MKSKRRASTLERDESVLIDKGRVQKEIVKQEEH